MAVKLEGEARHEPRTGAVAVGLFLQGLACLQVDFGQPVPPLLEPVLPGVIIDLEFLLHFVFRFFPCLEIDGGFLEVVVGVGVGPRAEPARKVDVGDALLLRVQAACRLEGDLLVALDGLVVDGVIPEDHHVLVFGMLEEIKDPLLLEEAADEIHVRLAVLDAEFSQVVLVFQAEFVAVGRDAGLLEMLAIMSWTFLSWKMRQSCSRESSIRKGTMSAW